MHLIQGLSAWDAVALVVGPIIGTGIFMKTAVMSQLLGHPSYVLLAWVVAAALSYAGALTYAELGSRFPRAGGEYAYLREGYGDLVAFLYGWMRMWIAGPGSIAAYAVGAATFLEPFLSLNASLLAISFIVFFTGLNCLTVKASGKVQTALTVAKLILIFAIVAGVVLKTKGLGHLGSSAELSGWPGWSAFGAALVAALWAFDGWNNLPMVGSEIQNPQRSIPLALAIGMLAVAVAYLSANLAFFVGIPFEQIVQAHSTTYPNALPVGTLATQTFMGPVGVDLTSVIFAVSALGAMHGSILTGARVPYAMAADGLMVKALAFIHPKTRSPLTAVIFESLVACALALSGSYDQLTDAVVFASWIFYALAAGSLLQFRTADLQSGLSRPAFLAPGYPLLPLLFVSVSLALLANTLYSSPQSSLLGLVTIGLGVPVHFLLKRRLS